VLMCPIWGEDLVYDAASSALVSVHSGQMWPVIDGRPIFTSAGRDVSRNPPDHLSHPLPPDALELIRNISGLVLNLSAGGTRDRFSNVIEAEYTIFRHTDVVADAHQLPFRDESFEAVISLNTFEHYRDPWTAVQKSGASSDRVEVC